MNESRFRLRKPQSASVDSERVPVAEPDKTSPVQPDEASKEGTQRWSAQTPAILALVGVVVGGVIAAGASIWVGNMTVKAQQKQTLMTVEAQQKQSVEEYRRNNRQKIYQDMLTQMSALESATKSIAVETAILHVGRQQISDEERKRIVTDAKNQWQPAYDRLSAAVSNAELVSSRQVIGIAKALLIAYNNDFYKMAYPEDALSQIKDSLKGMLGLTQGVPGTMSPPPSTQFPMPGPQPPPPATQFPMPRTEGPGPGTEHPGPGTECPGPATECPGPGTQEWNDLLPGITSSVGVPPELLGKSSADLKAIFLATAKKDVDLND